MQVRVRSKNPLIERRADTKTPKISEERRPEPNVEPRTNVPQTPMSEPPPSSIYGSTIYDRLEQSDSAYPPPRPEPKPKSEPKPKPEPKSKSSEAPAPMVTSAPAPSGHDLPVTKTAVRFGGAAIAPPVVMPKAAFLDDDETVLIVNAGPEVQALPQASERAPIPRVSAKVSAKENTPPTPPTRQERGARAETRVETVPHRQKAEDRNATVLESPVPKAPAPKVIVAKPKPTKAPAPKVKVVKAQAKPSMTKSSSAKSPVVPAEIIMVAADDTPAPRASAERAQTQAERPQRDQTKVDRGDPTPKKRVAPEVRLSRKSADARSAKVQAEEAPPSKLKGATPRNRLAIEGTKAAGNAVRRQMIQQMGDSLGTVSNPALRLVRGELSPPELRALERILSGEFDNRALDGSISPKRSLEHLINERNFSVLNVPDRAALLSAIASAPDDITTIKSSIAILKTGLLKRLSASERQQLLRLFARLGSETRARLAQLAARTLRGKSALEDRDFEDASLIKHIDALTSKGGFAPALERTGVRRDKLQNLILGAMASPERLSFEEGNHGVLGMLEFGLAMHTPAEFARLWWALTTGEMVAQLPGNVAIDLGRIVRSGREFTTHSHPLRVGLAQLPAIAHKRARANVDFIMPGGHGVDADILSSALSLLYGVGFTVAAGASTALRHLERLGSNHSGVPPVFVTMLYRRGERLFIFDHIEDDTLFVRAPHGRSTKRPGAYRIDPKRAVVSAEQAIDSIPLDEFTANVGVSLIPRT